MDVREGYKQTSLGAFPQDWIETLIGSVDPIMTSGSRGWAKFYAAHGNTFVRITNMSRESIALDLTDPCFVKLPTSKHEGERTQLAVGDLLVSITADIGIVSYVDDSLPLPAYINQHVALIRFQSNAVESKFVAYFLARGPGQRTFRATTDQGAKAGINLPTLRAVPIVVPPEITEQRAIATTLSDVDALLGALDRLIAKKRDLKQATMQQLLTGQTRLPGFSGEWEAKRLGEALSICHGRSQREVAVADGPYPILATGGQIGTASKSLWDKPSVLIGRKGTINQPQYMDQPFWSVDTLFYSAMNGRNDAKFFFYRFCLIDWLQYNEASGVPSLNARTIERIELACPEPDEQIAIASVLSDMDAEISALETRRAKTRDLKQAMMQELLTGRTRLV